MPARLLPLRYSLLSAMDFTNVPPLDLTVSLQMLLGLGVLHLVLKYMIFKNFEFTHSKAGIMAFETIAGASTAILPAPASHG